ncbi:AMP-binding protein [Longispora sp. K20-0274]|uniref:AMP-binding protein n=1 Tax=Longispora sp. K20-0274 TaxID=3088255 RepID=UPI0039999FEB
MHSLDEPENLADLIRRAAARDPERAALVAGARTVTWGELDSLVDATARGLLVRAVAPGDRVAVMLPNTVEFVAALYGIWRAGLIAVPINPGYTARERDHVLGDSGATLVIGPSGVDFDDIPLAGGPVADPGGGLAALLYTSGTAGLPKGAMLSHRALIANHHQLSQVSPPIVRSDDVVLLAVPLFHAYGLNSGLGAVAYHGATGVLVERFDPVDTLEQVRRHRVTTILGVPPMYVAWSLLPDLALSLESLRISVSGAAPLDVDTARRFQAASGHPIFEGYGLTETAPVLTSTLVGGAPKPGSVGRPVPGVEIVLTDFDGDEVEPGDPGEITARGDNLFDGYWPDRREGPDAEGWWRTGDVAYADPDGDLFLVDRLGELILVSGFNVYPHEVELVLCGHPDVVEAAVVGVPHPYTGQTVKAYVVVRQPVGVEELIAHCERGLARFKCPTAIEFVAELPHSVTGKVRKRELGAPREQWRTDGAALGGRAPEEVP